MTVTTPKKIFIDYTQFGIKLQKLYKKIRWGGVPTCIIGIANGGLNISQPLANWLQCKHITVSIHFYDQDKLASRPYYADIPPIPRDSVNLLLVDDILDSGTTIKYFIEKTGLVHGENFRIATLHWNKKGQHCLTPDFYINEKKENTWIVYPWESEFVETL